MLNGKGLRCLVSGSGRLVMVRGGEQRLGARSTHHLSLSARSVDFNVWSLHVLLAFVSPHKNMSKCRHEWCFSCTGAVNSAGCKQYMLGRTSNVSFHPNKNNGVKHSFQ